MKTVIVLISGGMVQEVEVPKGVRVLVRDYDVDNTTHPTRKDESGDFYYEEEWEANE